MEAYFTEHAGASGVEVCPDGQLMLAKCAGTRCQTGVSRPPNYELFTGWLLSKCEIFRT